MNDLWNLAPDDYALIERFGWCGCGSPEEAWPAVRDVLRAVGGGSVDELTAAAGGSVALLMIVLYDLNRVEAIEHGGSVWGAWRTPTGERLLQLLDAWAEAEFDSTPCSNLSENGDAQPVWSPPVPVDG